MKRNIKKRGHMDIEVILDWYSQEMAFLYGEKQLSKLTFLKIKTKNEGVFQKVNGGEDDQTIK